MKTFVKGLLLLVLLLSVSFSGAPVFAQGSKLTDLTELGEPPATSDVLYIVDLSEATAADRSKKITAQNLSRTHSKWVKSWTDFDTVGGESVYQIDLSVASTYYIDATSIFSATTMDPITGITVIFPEAAAGVSNIPFRVTKADSGATGVILVGYTSNCTSYQTMWVNVGTGGATNRSGTSDWEIDSQGDSKTFVVCPDPESAVSAWPVCKHIN